MTKKANLKYLLIIILFPWSLSGQDLKLKSKVELRNWKMTSKALKSETFLSGASLKLLKANTVVSEATSDTEGNFEINIPTTGEYTLLIEYPGREAKKFAVNAKAISPNKDDANFKPSVDIVGILMSKPKKDMEYIGLNYTSATVAHTSEKESKNGLHLRTTIYDGEYKLIQKFCTANKLGDMALEKKNYQLAKTFYLMAADMLENEDYPKTQLKKAEEGLKMEKVSRKKQSSKKSKVKSAITNQKTSSGATKNTSAKSSVETGKSTRKTRKTLGK